MDFLLYRMIGKSEKEFAKLFSWTVVFFLLIMLARARPLFLRTVFHILFRISQKNGKKGNPSTDIPALKSVFGFRVRLQIRNPYFKNLNPDFPIERTVKVCGGHGLSMDIQPTLALRTPRNAITRTATKSPAKTNYRRLTEINYRYYRLSLMRTLMWGPYSVRYKESWPYKIYFLLQIFSLS